MIQRALTSIRAKLALLAGVPVTGALLLALFVAHDARQRAASAASLGSIEDLARLASYIADVLHTVQDERAARSVADGLGPRGSAPVEAFRETDGAARRLDAFLSTRDRSKLPVRLARDLVESDALLHALAPARASRTAAADHGQDIRARYGAASARLVGAIAALPELSDDGEMLRNLSALVALLEIEERASVEEALVGYAAARGEFPPGAYKLLVTTTTEEEVYHQAFRTSASDEARQALEQARQRGHAASEMLDAILSSTEDSVTLDPAVWTRAQGLAVGELRGVERVLTGRIEAAAAGKGAELRKTTRLSLGVSLLVLVLSVSMAIFVGRGVQRSVGALADAARRVRASRDFSVRARRVSNDELGVLTETFNDMLAGIQARDGELEQHRSHLEGLVTARTQELAARNSALRLVLDNVDQGLATIGVGGVLNPERSEAFDRWFGSARGARPFFDALAPDDERLRALLDLGWQQVVDGLLPAEVSVEQLPKRFDRDERHFTLNVKLIASGEALAGALLVVTDVTTELEARREQARQREETQVFRRLARDKAAVVACLEETGSLVEQLRAASTGAPQQLALVHTMKGNAAQYDVRSVADAAHDMESEIVDAGAPLDAARGAPPHRVGRDRGPGRTGRRRRRLDYPGFARRARTPSASSGRGPPGERRRGAPADALRRAGRDSLRPTGRPRRAPRVASRQAGTPLLDPNRRPAPAAARLRPLLGGTRPRGPQRRGPRDRGRRRTGRGGEARARKRRVSRPAPGRRVRDRDRRRRRRRRLEPGRGEGSRGGPTHGPALRPRARAVHLGHHDDQERHRRLRARRRPRGRMERRRRRGRVDPRRERARSRDPPRLSPPIRTGKQRCCMNGPSIDLFVSQAAVPMALVSGDGRVLASSRPWDLLGRASPRPRDVRLQLTPWGDPDRWLAVATDVSDADERLAEMRERVEFMEWQALSLSTFAKVIAHTPVILSSIDARGVTSMSDGKGLELVGRKPGERVGVNELEASVGTPTHGHLQRALKGETVRALAEPARDVFFETWYAPLRNENDVIDGVITLAIDATERVRSEEKILENSKVIARQSETIRDLAAPVIKVWDEVVCLPIIGEVDAGRAAAMMEHLLESIVREKARFAILDLTGVGSMDTSTVHHVVRMLKAAQTVGAVGVLSGAQPAVAQTIVSLGLNLDDLRTVRTLHDALSFCLARRQADAQKQTRARRLDPLSSS